MLSNIFKVTPFTYLKFGIKNIIFRCAKSFFNYIQLFTKNAVDLGTIL